METDAARTIGDYPNSKNVREWMRLFFGISSINADLKLSFLHMRGELPDIRTAADALRFGLARGFEVTDVGRNKAFELGILSLDSPAIAIQPNPELEQKFQEVEKRKRDAAIKTLAVINGEKRGWVGAYFRGGEEFSFSMKRMEGCVFALCETSIFGILRQAIMGKDSLPFLQPELSENFSESDLLRFGNERGLLNADGLARLRDLTQTPSPDASPATAAKAAHKSKKPGASASQCKFRARLYEKRQSHLQENKGQRPQSWKVWTQEFLNSLPEGMRKIPIAFQGGDKSIPARLLTGEQAHLLYKAEQSARLSGTDTASKSKRDKTYKTEADIIADVCGD